VISNLDRTAAWRGRKRNSISRRMKRHWDLYLLLLAPTAFLIAFSYIPLSGIVLGFKSYNPVLGIWGSKWVGLHYFQQFFNSPYAWQTIRNTFMLSFYSLAMFPTSIILALALNEIRDGWFKKSSQMITYAPHFISTVVIASLAMIFLHERGPLNEWISWFGGPKISFLGDPAWFKPVYTATGVWQEIGFGSIIYLAALASIDPQLHESAKIDGASRYRRIIHINIPGILPTIVIMLILSVGRLMSLEYEKVFLFQNPVNLSSSEIINTMVYKVGLIGGDFSYSTAIGFFNSIINLVLILLVNRLARKLTETSLW